MRLKKQRYVRKTEDEQRSDKDEEDTFEQDQLPIQTDTPPTPLLMSKAVKTTLSFLIPKPRRIPGVATSNLSAAVKEYNKAIMASPRKNVRETEEKPKPAAAITRDIHFKPPIDSCEVDIRGAAVVIIFSDDKNQFKVSIEKFSSYSKVENDTLKERISVGSASAAICTHLQEHIILQMGKKEVVKDEVVRGGLFSRGQRKAVVVEGAERAFSLSALYTPAAFRAPNEPHPSSRMYEITGSTSILTLSYAHSHLIQGIELLYAYQKDKIQLNAADMQEIERKQNSQLTFREKFAKLDRKLRHENTLMTFSSEELAKKILLLKGKFHKMVKEADEFVDPINFNVQIAFGGLNLALNEQDSASSLCDLHFPQGKFEFEKVENRVKALIWGFGVTSNSSFGGISQFFQVFIRQTAAILLEDKMKAVRRLAGV